MAVQAGAYYNRTNVLLQSCYLKKANTLPTTLNPSPGDYVSAIKKLDQQSMQMVVLTMTSKGSGAYPSCLAAIEMLRDKMPKLQVEVVDTLAVAMAQGWSVIEAARAARKGLALTEVVAKAKEVASKSMMLMTADALRYLYMGGRIGRAQHLMGSLLNSKPIIGSNKVIDPRTNAVKWYYPVEK